MSGYSHPLGTVAGLPEDALGSLAAELDGDLVLPDDDGYRDARTPWNGLVNKYPAVVVRVANSDDVAAGIRFARTHDLELSIRGGAHNQTGSAFVDNGVVVDLSELDAVAVDPDEQTARVGPGTRAEDVLAETQEYGLAPPTGSAGDVGIPGSTLSGGIGWQRRANGLGIDALREVELVTADGEVVTASPDERADLFWAIRGGGGNFGVVTEFTFDLYEVGPIVGGLGIFYPAADAEAVFDAYSEFTADAPEEATTIMLHGEVPALPPVPDELAGQDAVAILGCYAGDPETGMELFAPLREVAEPLLDMSEPMPYELLHDLGTQMYPWGRNYSHRSVFVDDLDDVLGVVEERSEDAPSELSAIGVWHLGGNVGHGPEAAYPWAEKEYLLTIEANWESVENSANLEWARETERLLRDAGAEGAYGGFTGVEEQSWEDWTEQVYGDSYDRLVDVKTEYDPENVFSQNVNVTPAGVDD